MRHLKVACLLSLIILIVSCSSEERYGGEVVEETITPVTVTTSSIATTTTSPATLAEQLAEGKTCEESWQAVPAVGSYKNMSESDRASVRATVYSCGSFVQWGEFKDVVRPELLEIQIGGLISNFGPLDELCENEPRANPNVCITRAEYFALHDPNPSITDWADGGLDWEGRPTCRQLFEQSIRALSRGYDGYSDLLLRASLYRCTLTEWQSRAESNGENWELLRKSACAFEPRAIMCG